MKSFPLDTFVDQPVDLVAVVPGDTYKPAIWAEYRKIIGKHKVNLPGCRVMKYYQEKLNRLIDKHGNM